MQKSYLATPLSVKSPYTKRSRMPRGRFKSLVQRRVLFDMSEAPSGPRQAAPEIGPVSSGETMGKYHPHGGQLDRSDTLDRIIPGFQKRIKNKIFGAGVDGHGNFGSIEKVTALQPCDNTEARLNEEFAEEVYLKDLVKTVDSSRTTDETGKKSRKILPVRGAEPSRKRRGGNRSRNELQHPNPQSGRSWSDAVKAYIVTTAFSHRGRTDGIYAGTGISRPEVLSRNKSDLLTDLWKPDRKIKRSAESSRWSSEEGKSGPRHARDHRDPILDDRPPGSTNCFVD